MSPTPPPIAYIRKVRQAMLSHKHAPAFMRDYPSSVTLPDIGGTPVRFAFMPHQEQGFNFVTLTIQRGGDIPITLDPAGADLVILGQFAREAGKTARWPNGRPHKGQVSPPHSKHRHENHDFSGDDHDDTRT